MNLASDWLIVIKPAFGLLAGRATTDEEASCLFGWSNLTGEFSSRFERGKPSPDTEEL